MTLDEQLQKMKATALRDNSKTPNNSFTVKPPRPVVTEAWVRSTYRTGDGDTPVVIRPGSMDFLKCKSRGLG